MNNFNFRNNPIFPNSCPNKCNQNDERFGGFLLPFITGAVVSAPFWFVAGNNKAQYNNQPYPMYYPYQGQYNQPPTYYPDPPYR